MKKQLNMLAILSFLLLLTACRQPDAETIPPPEPTKTEPPPTAETNSTESDETAVSPTATPITPPERTLYQSGLVSAAQDSLDALPNATTYQIALDVDFEAGLVSGSQIVHYTNDENVELDNLYFHLLPTLLGGLIDVNDVILVNGKPVEPVLEEDGSIMRVPLDAPLAPGDSVMLEMDFVTAVPQQLERNYGVFAQVDDIMALSHFYPMAAVYDDDGWNITPPSEQGDATYGDAAFYHVTVSTDDEQVVAGSGIVLNESSAGGRTTREFAIGPARDFYLAISPRYQMVSRTAGETTINSYAPTEFMAGAEDAADFAAGALRIFGERFGPYPYTEFDIVATSTLALGIEYPGIVALTAREYDPDEPINSDVSNQIYMETTTAHEVAHQWFYSLVGNDQLDQPWLDEAVTQYATYLYYVDMYGQEAANGYKDSWHGRFSRVDSDPIPIGRPVSAYEGREYSAIIYGRGPLFVEALAAEMGQDTFDAFLADYVAQNKWGIATTESFRQLAEEHCACTLEALFAGWVYE